MLLRNTLSELYSKVLFYPLIHHRIVASAFHVSSLVYNENAQYGRSEDEFRVLDIKKIARRDVPIKRRVTKSHVLPPRTEKMSETQEWSDVWPGPRTFHPAVVPLPVRQGRNKLGPVPDKYGNAELMKIPNFLHLTPPAIKKHCEAIKKFCTPWPKGLETDESCEKHFPVEVITSDYCHSSPTIRDPLARIVTIRFQLSRLPLDRHSKDKFLRLVGDRYNTDTDVVTIVTDRCPLRKQNYDYAMYLLTALFHESWNFEAWEKEKSENDMEFYVWELNRSKDNVSSIVQAAHPGDDNKELSPQWKINIDKYKEATVDLFNLGENEETLKKYKDASVNLLCFTS
ncbi:mitochondrial ribosomal protein S35 [Lycorma delicatula]|uniref:mitochondrial ribosomal protein S35 n=1 Tax=Lycorma delicatula TaxID=130591 RepID=UPI003F511606